MIYFCAPISTRNQFGEMLTHNGLTQRAVEIGTHRGEFSYSLMRNWPGHLWCVDPWSIPKGYEWQAEFLNSTNREEDYRIAKDRLHEWRHRVTFLREMSLEAVRRFADASVDFCYLDGDHERPGIDDDLAVWWPKIRQGGILAGHDWLCPGEKEGGWGQFIQPAVDEFARANGIRQVHFVVEENGLPWSFYVVKA